MRVYEFSKKYGLPTKELVKLLQEGGFDIASHMSVLSPDAQTFLEKKLNSNQPSTPHISTAQEPAPVTATPSQPSSRSPEASRSQAKPLEPVAMPLEPMTIADLAAHVSKPVSEIILMLLRQGFAANKNQVVSEKIVSQIAQHYGIKTSEPAVKKALSHHTHAQIEQGARESRLPIVVVIGHVDHGKTTLLDFIRKTRVAAKEKGGITQHLGAYEAYTPHGNLVFLDTPGHEAFSRMRERGIRVADIAILVVAADDGIMPQTIEAIKHAKAVGLPIIVAINKIDKATAQQIEAVKRGLVQYDLVPEEWGGQTVVVPISAKLGQGVNELLDLIILQSQLMELTAHTEVLARGYVLESRMEKGRGSVATVILHDGILHVGDYFRAGDMYGRVSSLTDYMGKRIDAAYPSKPVQVSGFTQLPPAGDPFEIIPQEELKRERTREQKPALARQVLHENALNLVIKTDTISSQEALLEAIGKMGGKAFKELYVVHAAVGMVTEGDVILAHDTKSLIYTLHSKVEPTAAALAQKLGVSTKTFGVIYQLLDDLAFLVEQGKPAKKVTKKTGEAVVVKVFVIKNLGTIAGAHVKSGRCSRDGKVTVWRGKYKIGEGPIKSLQREKKSVKEVHAGFECAFLIEGFDDWQVDDRVECYLEVAETP